MNRRVVRTVQAVGIVLFIAAFFLPAVREPGEAAAAPGARHLLGWQCATFAAAATGTLRHLNVSGSHREALGTLCLAMSGWVNPLVFFYLLCSIWRSLVAIRRIFAAGVVLCYIATWIFFYEAPLVPLLGHFLWALGGFLILAGELGARRRVS